MAYELIFLAAALWGLIGLLTKGMLAAGIEPLEIAFWRAALSGLLFCAHAGLRGDLYLKRRRDSGFFLGFALVGILHYVSFILAVDHGGVNLAVVLLAAAPVFVVVGAWLLLREALTPLKLGLVLVTLLGVLLVSGGGGEGMTVSALAIFWGLLAAASHASLYLFDKWMLGRYSPVTICALLMPLGALMLGPLVTFSPKSLQVWGLLLLLVFFSTYVAYFLYYTGLKRIEASRAVLVTSVEPVIAATLAALVFGEHFGLLGYVGASLIFCAALLVSLPQGNLRNVAAVFARQSPLPPERS
jgi:drug/metabolite transporter (DMT)-like permease